MSEKFTKAARLRKRKDFQRVNRSGKRLVGRFLLVDVLQRQDENSRLGITATRRFGKAHVRVRFKRIVREAFRRSVERLPKGIDLNVRPRSMGRNASSFEVAEELVRLLS